MFVINGNPHISATVVDENTVTKALTGDSNKIVKYFSNAKVTITATAIKSATIKSQKVVCEDGKSATTAISTLNAVESGKFVASCVDSRNLTSSITINKALVNYIKLAFTQITLKRLFTTSNTVNVNLQGNYFNASFGVVSNTLTLKWRWRIKGGTWSSYSTITATLSGNTFNYSGMLGTNFDYQNEYEFEFNITDKLMSVSRIKPVTQGVPIIDIGKNSVKVNGAIIGNADSATRTANLGNVTAETTSKPSQIGISMQTAYNNGYPYNYGNVLNMLGSGATQLFFGWSDKCPIYIRSYRDTGTSWFSWERIHKAKTLYDNGSGTTGTVTLSETAANFDYLVVFFKNTQGSTNFDFTAIPGPNRKNYKLEFSS